MPPSVWEKADGRQVGEKGIDQGDWMSMSPLRNLWGLAGASLSPIERVEAGAGGGWGGLSRPGQS